MYYVTMHADWQGSDIQIVTTSSNGTHVKTISKLLLKKLPLTPGRTMQFILATVMYEQPPLIDHIAKWPHNHSGCSGEQKNLPNQLGIELKF